MMRLQHTGPIVRIAHILLIALEAIRPHMDLMYLISRMYRIHQQRIHMPPILLQFLIMHHMRHIAMQLHQQLIWKQLKHLIVLIPLE